MDSGELLKRVSQLKSDAIFLDVQMPTIDGLQLLSHIRANSPDSKNVFVIAYANYAVDAYEQELDRLCKVIRRQVPLMKCFGKRELVHDETKLTWNTLIAEELFAYLLFHDGVTVERLQDDVFANFSLAKSKSYLSTCVYMIRNSLRKIGLVEHVQIESGGGCYRLKLIDVESEWQQLQTRTANGQPVNARWAFERLSRILFLGLDSEWLYRFRHDAERALINVVIDDLSRQSLTEVHELKKMLFDLTDYLPGYEPFWSVNIDRLHREQLDGLAAELQQRLAPHS